MVLVGGLRPNPSHDRELGHFEEFPKICPRFAQDSDRFQGINYHRDHHNLTDSEDGAQVNSSITPPGDRLQGNLPIAESGYSSRGDRD